MSDVNRALVKKRQGTAVQVALAAFTYLSIIYHYPPSAPSTWNSFPVHIRSSEKLSTFKCQLKSHFFQSAFTL